MAVTPVDPVVLARAYRALDGTGSAPLPPQRTLARAGLAALAALVLAVGAALPAAAGVATAPPKQELVAEAEPEEQ